MVFYYIIFDDSVFFEVDMYIVVRRSGVGIWLIGFVCF